MMNFQKWELFSGSPGRTTDTTLSQFLVLENLEIDCFTKSYYSLQDVWKNNFSLCRIQNGKPNNRESQMKQRQFFDTIHNRISCL